MVAQAVFLLVEDDENDALLVRRAFTQAKVTNPLVAVSSCEEAIEYFEGKGRYANRGEFPLPALVLLDLKFKGVDGFEFLTWLRSQPGFGQTRVIVLSGSQSVDDLNRAYQAGANSFLTKPSDFEKLIEISRAFNGFWVWTDTPPQIHPPSPVTLL
jgi:CheY-like chemotaxis protein